MKLSARQLELLFWLVVSAIGGISMLALVVLGVGCHPPPPLDSRTARVRERESEARASALCDGVCGVMGKFGMDWSLGRDRWLKGPIVCRCGNGKTYRIEELGR